MVRSDKKDLANNDETVLNGMAMIIPKVKRNILLFL